MLTAAQAREIAAKAKTEQAADKWKPTMLQIEAQAMRGCHSIDCMELDMSGNSSEELKALMLALGYEWRDGSFGSFSIHWH